MHGFVPPDPDSKVSQVHYAVIYAPRRDRKRHPANCVYIKNDDGEALAQADPEKNLYAAAVLGPSKSSEGQYIYYLVEWLDGGE